MMYFRIFELVSPALHKEVSR